jgi:small-conductance mechanosensitive channel
MQASEAFQLFDITLVGATPDNGKKLLLTIFLIAVVLLFATVGRRLLAGTLGQRARLNRFRFWARQVVALTAGAILILGIVSIWFDDPTRLATALGLVTAGIAFALQRVITAIAGYFVILRGKTFNVGDRIVMGGVRGDMLFRRTSSTPATTKSYSTVAASQSAMSSQRSTGGLPIIGWNSASAFSLPIMARARSRI